MGNHVVMIGGGLGGLVCGCLLSKEGYKVTILEKHNRVGGGLHCFERYGQVFDTGIHYISGVQEGGALRKILEYIGVFDQLKFCPLDQDGFDYVHLGTNNTVYKLGLGKEQFVENLAGHFPAEKENLERYLAAIYEICDSIPLYNLRPSTSLASYFQEEFMVPVGKFIESYVKEPKLIGILGWNNCLYAGSYDYTPLYIHALITKFYIEGATRMVDGSQQLADAMGRVIVEHGGEVYCNAEVKRIIVKNKKTEKVITADGREFSAGNYVSDIHPAVLMDMIDPHEVPKAYRERLKSLENTHSAFTVYATFKPGSFPYLNHNYYFFIDEKAFWEPVYTNPTVRPPGFMLLTPPEENQSEFAGKMIVNCMVSFELFRKWENTTSGKRDAEYKEFKLVVQEKILDEIEKVFPGVRQAVDKVFSATPLTVRDYLGTKEGSLYGYKKDIRTFYQSQLMPKTKVENLFLTGQNINLHGIMGVPLNAIITAGAFVGVDNLLNKINRS